MATTVAYDRVPGYPKESITRSGSIVTDMMQCEWTDRIALAKELLGFTIGSILYKPDEYNAGDDALLGLYCSNVVTDPVVGLDLATGDYKKARLTVTYENPDYDIDNVPDGSTVYVTESLEPSAEFLTLSEKGLYWSDDEDVEANDAPQKIVRMMDWVYTKHSITSQAPINEMFNLLGYVNDASVYSRALNRYFSAETLLYGNPSLTREVTDEGTTAWTITYRFAWRNNGTYVSPQGWNHFPRSKKDTSGVMNFERIYNAKGGASDDILYPYPKTSFAGVID